MLTIVVSRKKVLVTTVDGITMRVSLMLAKENGNWRELRDYSGFTNVTAVEFFSERWWGFKKFPKCPVIEKGVVEFLNHYHAKQEMHMDCYAFANLVYGVPLHRAYGRFEFWNIDPAASKHQVGDVILMTHSEKVRFHTAIYIGFGYYISTYGAGGDLEVATLADMKRDFEVSEVAVATPKT